MSYMPIRILTALALAAGLTYAQGVASTKPVRQKMLGQKLVRQLNLTDAQKQQSKAIVQQARRDSEPLKQELKQNRKAMSEAVQSGKNESEIRQLAAAQGATLGQLIAVRSQARARFLAQLTPEQKAKAAEARQQIRQKLQRKQEKRLPG